LQGEEKKADDEALQMVLKRLKILEQENDGPERRELLKKRKKQLKELLSQRQDDFPQNQLALQKRFEHEVHENGLLLTWVWNRFLLTVYERMQY